MELNPYFLVAAGGLAYFVYRCYEKTPGILPAQREADNKTVLISHYVDPADEWSNRTLLTTNLSRIKNYKTENGPLGVPRNYYVVPGNGRVVTHGNCFTAL